MNNAQVAHAWAHGHTGKGSNLRTDGVTLTSYSTMIAARIDDVVYISSDNMSPTTAKHLSYARRAVNHEREKIFYTPVFSRWNSDPALTHEAMLRPAAREAEEVLDRVISSRARKATKDAAVYAYVIRRAKIMELAERYNVSITMPDIAATPEGLEQYKAEKEEQRKEAERRAREAKEARKAEEAEQFRLWLETGAGRCPYAFQERGIDLITLRGDMVITSQGAEAPLDHVIKALRFYDSRRTDSGFMPYHTNGHKIHLGMFTLDEILENGDVKAGCHYFEAAEITRFRAQWREVLEQ